MSLVLPISITLALLVAGFFMGIDSPPALSMVAFFGTLAGSWYVLEEFFRNRESNNGKD